MPKKFIAVIAALVSAFLFCACAATGYTVFAPVSVFSSDIALSCKLYGGRVNDAYKRVKQIVEEIGGQVSTTDDSSDLYRFNAAPADFAVEVGEHTYALYNKSVELYELTDGAFNPAVLPLIKLWGIDTEGIKTNRPDIDGSYNSASVPSLQEVASALEYCDLSRVTASSENGKYYLTKTDERVMLDFGGVAKGYCADRCAEILAEYGVASGVVDISGNVYFYGSSVTGDEGYWAVGVNAPRPRAGEVIERGYVCALNVEGNKSVVTSGDYMRYVVHDKTSGGKVYIPHILGKDGIPAGVRYADGEYENTEDSVISATVIGDSSAKCDALSTAVVALGIQKGAELLQKSGYKGLIFTEKKYIIINGAELYKPDIYSGYCEYEPYEH